MGHHHVAIGAGLLVEAGALGEAERFRHVDLHVIDEVAIPDRLEEAVGEAEGEDVLRRLLAEEVVDPEDLFLGEDLVQLRVQRDRAVEIGAEGLLHDDARATDEFGLGEQAHRRQRRLGRDTEIVDEPRFALERGLGALDRGPERAGARRQRHIVERIGEMRPVGLVQLPGGELVERAAGDLPKGVGIHLVERDADHATSGNEARLREMEQPRQKFAPRQVTRRADQNHDLRVTRTDPARNLHHACPSRSADPELASAAPKVAGFGAATTGRRLRRVAPGAEWRAWEIAEAGAVF